MINLAEDLLVNKYKIKHNVFELYKQALNDIEDQLWKLCHENRCISSKHSLNLRNHFERNSNSF